MKALEKAAKEREESTGERAPSAVGASAGTPVAATRSEFTLEPMPAAPPPAAASERDPTPPPREPPVPPRRPGANPPAAPAGPSREPAHAAAVIGASKRDTGGGFVDYIQDHPWLIIGSLSALFLMGYFTYVYLQVKNPAMFAKQPPAVAQPAPAPGSPPPPSATAPAAPSAGAPGIGGQQEPISLGSLLPRGGEGRVEGTIQEKAALEPSPAAPGKAGADNSSLAVSPRAPSTAARAQEPAARTESAATAAGSRPARETIRVTAGRTPPAINPQLASAYASLNAGNLETSQRLYNQVLQSEPSNVDAMLGLAAIANQQGDGEQASRHYMKLLEIDPRNALAQAGLIAMVGRADPLGAESRLKQLISREPSAYLYFTLGNLYADQNRWPDAQQAYFQAHHLQSDNPDYAYNLAVGLEHVGQPKLALNFYRRALQLGAANPRINFSNATVEERISKLQRVVE